MGWDPKEGLISFSEVDHYQIKVIGHTQMDVIAMHSPQPVVGLSL